MQIQEGLCFVCLNTKTTGFSDFKAAALTLTRSEASGKGSNIALETALYCGQCCSHSNIHLSEWQSCSTERKEQKNLSSSHRVMASM